MRLTRIAQLISLLFLMLSACGGVDEGSDGGSVTTTPGEVVAGDPVNGAVVYAGSCASCHARDLSGVDGLGMPLAPNAFVESNSEEDLIAFLVVGRRADDPLNNQGIDMQPRGGNPSLTDQDLADVSAYLKAHQ
ncbi:MAG TPA: cytochrome c [Acidimicrobiia bacterium]|nr:cytochrome c [Acidimicrobiia bacterium]